MIYLICVKGYIPLGTQVQRPPKMRRPAVSPVLLCSPDTFRRRHHIGALPAQKPSINVTPIESPSQRRNKSDTTRTTNPPPPKLTSHDYAWPPSPPPPPPSTHKKTSIYPSIHPLSRLPSAKYAMVLEGQDSLQRAPSPPPYIF